MSDQPAGPDGEETESASSPPRGTYATGMRIGPYKILGLLGEGGFGIVYHAEQTEPVRRRVALKVIKPGMDTRAVIARFEAERQALALMDHPNVARVFDVGTTEHGRPYFVMEHVPGLPITEHCDRHKLTIDRRLDLFMQVCEAVQHAHQKGIIHRDIKPKNILVSISDGKAVPKVIDFGVAKAISQPLTEKTLFTEQGVLIGTPAYMSPEQAERTAQDIDTRSDIYSLGAVLYELLTGTLPLDPESFRRAAFDEVLRIIREVEPAKPSTLTHVLRGDLDWIIMKALDKDRTRRYASATDLAADIRRHLRHEPVVAGPPSAAYRISKFARRNRGVMTAAVIVFAVLVAGIVGTTSQAVIATRQRDRAVAERARAVAAEQAQSHERQRAEAARVAEAEQREVAEAERERAEQARTEAEAEAEKAKRIQEFLQDMVASADPLTGKGHDTTVREILDAAAIKVQTELQDQPEVEAAIRHTIGVTYLALAFGEQAEPHLREALTIRRRILGGEHLDVAETLRYLSLSLYVQGSYDEAMTLSQGALAIRGKLLGEDHILTLEVLSDQVQIEGDIGDHSRSQDLGAQWAAQITGDSADTESFWEDVEAKLAKIREMWSKGKRREAEVLIQEMAAPYMNALGPNEFVPFALTVRAREALTAGDYDLAEPLYRAALTKFRELYGDQHPSVAQSLMGLGSVLSRKHEYEAAAPLVGEALKIFRKLLGDDHRDTLNSIVTMGILLKSMGKLEEAMPYYREALEGFRRVLGDDHPDTLTLINNMGGLLFDMGKLEETEPYWREELEGSRRVLGDDHPSTWISINNMAYLLNEMGKYEEAEAYYREALESRRRTLPEGHAYIGGSCASLGTCLLKLERYTEAAAALLEAHRILKAARGAEHERTLKAVTALVDLYDAWGKPEQAAEWRAKLPPPETQPAATQPVQTQPADEA